MKKFDLFIGFFGNGAAVYNKAEAEHGDYKKVAHIAECGKITWYAEHGTVPGKDLLRIEHTADTMSANWEHSLNLMPLAQRYEKLADMIPESVYFYIANLGGDLERKIKAMKDYIYNN